MTSAPVKQFTDIYLGQSATHIAVLDADAISAYATLCGDHNPIHEDADYVARTRFGRRVAHGLLVASFVQTALTKLVAPGGVSASYQFTLHAPAYEGTSITAEVVCTDLDPSRRRATFSTTVFDDMSRTELIRGSAVIAFPKGDQR